MKLLSKVTRSVLAAATVALLAVPASAAVVHDNGLPNTSNGYQIGGTNSTADDFSIASGDTVKSVGFYFQNYNGITGWDGNISYKFMSDSGGTPGATLTSGAGVNVTAVDSGLAWCCGGGNAWLVTFDLASDFIAAAGTTYWLGLTGAGGPNPWWVTSGTGGNGFSDTGGGYGNNGYEFAFYLDNEATAGPSPVPLPAGLPLLAGGIFLLGALRRRRG